MHSDGPFRAFGDFEKFLQNHVARRAAVQKVQIIVAEAAVGESIRVVRLPIQSDHVRDVIAFEIREVVFGSVFLRVACNNWSDNVN